MTDPMSEAEYLRLTARDNALRDAARLLNCKPDDVPDRVKALLAPVENRAQPAAGEISLSAPGFLALTFGRIEPRDLVAATEARALASGVTIGFGVQGGRASLVVIVRDRPAIDAAALARTASASLGGTGGGGRRDMARGGGPNASAIFATMRAIHTACVPA